MMPPPARQFSPDPSQACVLACSARRHGNTDTAAELACAGLAAQTERACRTIRVADHQILPCISCGYCFKHPGACSQDNNGQACPQTARTADVALPLLHRLCEAPVACLVSPIYFYHLPAQAKALVDRAQSFWALPPERKPGQGGQLGVILLGARPRGKKLFAGALLTLHYMAEALGLTLADPLLLYGLDEVDALRQRPDAQERIKAYALALHPKPVSAPANRGRS